MPHNRLINNAKWIIVCKVAQSIIQLIVGLISARYLGPSNYGLISYAGSVVAFAVPFMQLGMASTLVQEYVSKPEKEGAVLGTALTMNLVSSLLCMCGVAGFALAANHGEQTTIIVCVLYSVCLIFQAMEMLQYWFQAKLLSKYSSLTMLAAHIAVSAYKVFLLISGKSVHWFALAHAVEYAVAGTILLVVYKRVGTQKLAFSIELAKEMFAKSKYYILASLMVTVFQNTDRVMLKMMVGDAETGFYAAAITCACVVSFVYNAIIDSGRPAILESKKRSQADFETNVSRLYSVILYLAFLQSVFFTVFAKLIVAVLYGKDFAPAVRVLQIIIWQEAFSYMGTVRNIWILGEEKHSLLWRINLCGVGANIVLNAVMIPVWGACGAALASVITQIFTNFVVGFIMPSIRRNNVLLLKGLNPKCMLDIIGKTRQ